MTPQQFNLWLCSIIQQSEENIIGRMKTTNFVNLNTTTYDEEFMKESMVSRVVEVRPHVVANLNTRFEVRSSKIYKADYVTCTIRSEEEFDDLIDHVNQEYGGYLIPVIQKIDSQKHPDDAAEAYETYLNELLENRSIRDDHLLFKFFFIQEQESPEKSSYDRFLSNAIELSRKHINQLFTRQDKDQLIKFDKQLQQLRDTVALKREKYQQVLKFITIKCEEYQNLNEILDILEIGAECSPEVHLHSRELYAKSQRVLRIFQRIEGAYHRRLMVKERIKELKADNIRHQYNSMHESTAKVLEQERERNEVWNERMFKEIECGIVIIDSLIRELMKNYETLEKLCYVGDGKVPSVPGQ